MGRLWAALNYDLSKAVFMMRDLRWRLQAHVLVIGPFGLMIVWRKKMEDPHRDPCWNCIMGHHKACMAVQVPSYRCDCAICEETRQKGPGGGGHE